MASIRNTKEAILDAARADIIEFGAQHATLTSIAKRAGISRPTLYRHYPDLRAIFSEMITREVITFMPAATLSGPVLTTLVGALVEGVRRARQDELVGRILASDHDLLSPYVFERLGASQRSIIGILAEAIRLGHLDGSIAIAGPHEQATMVLLIVQSAVMSGRIVTEFLPPQALDDQLTRALTGYLEAPND